jgi:hypothetical protein
LLGEHLDKFLAQIAEVVLRQRKALEILEPGENE